MSSSVAVICQNAIAREGLMRILSSDEFDSIGSASDIDSFEWSTLESDGLVVLDIPDSQVREDALDMVGRDHPSARTVVLADMMEVESMLSCFRKGAQGYIIKDMDCAGLMASLKLIAAGQKIVPPSIIDEFEGQSSPLVKSTASEETLERANLSDRETDVLCCLMAGQSNKVIARELSVSEATVKVHVKAILRKIKVGNRTQAAIWGTSKGAALTSTVNWNRLRAVNG